MALTDFQRRVCRLLADSRRRRGDLFHDSDEALRVTWDDDRRLLQGQGFGVEILRERPTFVEAVVGLGPDRLRLPVLPPRRAPGLRLHPPSLHLGLLLWGACGKDPGFGPSAILSHARRAARYTQAEISELAFDGEAPDAATRSRTWHAAAAEAEEVIDALPVTRTGTCVLDARLRLFRGSLRELRKAIDAQALRYHEGTIRGAYPELLPA